MRCCCGLQQQTHSICNWAQCDCCTDGQHEMTMMMMSMAVMLAMFLLSAATTANLPPLSNRRQRHRARAQQPRQAVHQRPRFHHCRCSSQDAAARLVPFWPRSLFQDVGKRRRNFVHVSKNLYTRGREGPAVLIRGSVCPQFPQHTPGSLHHCDILIHSKTLTHYCHVLRQRPCSPSLHSRPTSPNHFSGCAPSPPPIATFDCQGKHA